MVSGMGVSSLVLGMFLTGCANSLLTKWQDKQCVENCNTADRVYFEQPVWQTLNMFIGEFMCIIPLLLTRKPKTPSLPQTSIFTRIISRLPGTGPAETGYDPVEDDDSDADSEVDVGETLHGWRVCWLWFPAFFDSKQVVNATLTTVCGTTLMNVGLILTPVSIYQMSRGALVLWVGILSVTFLRRQLWLYQWTSLIIVTFGVSLVGLSGSLQKSNTSVDDPAKVALGVLLILAAQIFTACQYVVEEKIMAKYKTEPLAAVTFEGFFGLATTLLAMPILNIFKSRSDYFDMIRGWHQIISNPVVMWLSFAICFSIGAFNFFGLSVTHRVSATARSTIDTCRTLGIWFVSLGVGWEHLVYPYSLLQVAGFGLLVYGTFVFNGLLKPMCFEPPSSIQLPHEPELEETGELPAAQEARAGYDVLPDDERR